MEQNINQSTPELTPVPPESNSEHVQKFRRVCNGIAELMAKSCPVDTETFGD